MMSSDSKQQTVTLAFHKLTSSYTYGSTNYSPRRFTQLLRRFRTYGLLPTDQNGGEGKVELTFDDGYAHLAETLPALVEEFGVRSTVFLPTGWIGRNNRWDYSNLLKSERHLNAPEIRSLALDGVRFGSHGHSHRALTTLDDVSLFDELKRSRAILEDILGEAVTTVSYPFGKTDERVCRAARQTGYTHGYSVFPPSMDDHDLALGRIPVHCFDTPTTIIQKINDTGLSRVWRGLGRAATAMSSGTVLLHKLKLLRTEE